jgi:Peptidyl-tRNA hydrolase
VLKPFARAEADQVALQVDSACEAITMVVSEGLAAAQQRFHAPG